MHTYRVTLLYWFLSMFLYQNHRLIPGEGHKRSVIALASKTDKEFADYLNCIM